MIETEFTIEERNRIEAGIRGKYTKVAASLRSLFQYPVGRAGLEALNYDTALIRRLPESVAASFCGVGNPFTLGPINEGASILDVGCGAGVDTILAGMMAGPTGRAVGIDMIAGMLDRARENLRRIGVMNVTFQQASAEQLPFPDGTFDVVISNGVFNLVPDKRTALKEVFRVLKPDGRLMVADQALTVPSEQDRETMVARWFQ